MEFTKGAEILSQYRTSTLNVYLHLNLVHPTLAGHGVGVRSTQSSALTGEEGYETWHGANKPKKTPFRPEWAPLGGPKWCYMAPIGLSVLPISPNDHPNLAQGSKAISKGRQKSVFSSQPMKVTFSENGDFHGRP